MLSGTYSSICIATPVLADLKEREPQYRALAKRVAQRAAGGRAAKRAAAKAGVGAEAPAAPGRGLAGDEIGDLPDEAGPGADEADDAQPGEPGGQAEAGGQGGQVEPV